MSFSDSAYERLSKVAPELLNMVVSFQDLSDQIGEDSRVKIGTFAIKSGSKMYFIPVVAKGSSVYPIDSVFCTEKRSFFPLSPAGIAKVRSAISAGVGKGVKIPSTVDRNPSLREMVEPPRTGKYVYAGSGAEEIMAIAPEHIRKPILTKLASDMELAKDLHRMGFDVEGMKDALSKQASEVHPAKKPVQVITEGEGLEDEVVQKILRHGYAIIGEPREPRIAIQKADSNDGFTTLNAAQPGNAYEVIMKDGSTQYGFVPHLVKTTGVDNAEFCEGDSPAIGFSPVSSYSKLRRGYDHFIVLESGNIIHNQDVVISSTPLDYLEVVKMVVDNNPYLPISEIDANENVVIVTPKGCIGPVYINRRDEGREIQRLTTRCDKVINVVPSMKAGISVVKNEIFVPATTAAIVLARTGTSINPETDISMAYTRKEMKTRQFLQENHVLSYDGVEFSLDGKPYPEESEVVKQLVVVEGLSPECCISLIHKADEEGRVDFYMSKKASHSNEIPSYGVGVPDEHYDISNRFSSTVKDALKTKDKQVVEASLISQFINDPDMYETIESYLPNIDEAVNKLGRSILLLRLKSEEASERMDLEEFSDLLTSLRNVFRQLGDTSIRLENLANNVRKA